MSTESTEASLVKPAVLITIIGESVLRDRIVKLLKSKGVTGYTLSEVLGEGGHGRRMGDIAGFNTNIEIKTIVTLEESDDILRSLLESRNGHALIAFRHNVETLSN
ncbi:MAG TPA: hypothetical protein V6D14_20695 [Coleofasciculaceae cyanobacterium]|jgi:nitrogen regulatory protein PII